MINPHDGAEGWLPNEPPPSNFDQVAYQKRINDIVGTRDGRPIIRLAWAPEEFRWWPIRVGEEEVRGYTFPIFHAFTTAEGELVAAPRWVLMERVESAHYAPTPQFWEAKRYRVDDGSLWDLSGPIPAEKYIELRCHSYHDGLCCTCIGTACKCGIEYAHCWGRYAEPDNQLLEWVRKVNYEVNHDADVSPDSDVRYFEAKDSQHSLASLIIDSQQRRREDRRIYNDYMLGHWERKPHSVILPS